jgi:hypothetical protein
MPCSETPHTQALPPFTTAFALGAQVSMWVRARAISASSPVATAAVASVLPTHEQQLPATRAAGLPCCSWAPVRPPSVQETGVHTYCGTGLRQHCRQGLCRRGPAFCLKPTTFTAPEDAPKGAANTACTAARVPLLRLQLACCGCVGWEGHLGGGVQLLMLAAGCPLFAPVAGRPLFAPVAGRPHCPYGPSGYGHMRHIRGVWGRLAGGVGGGPCPGCPTSGVRAMTGRQWPCASDGRSGAHRRPAAPQRACALRCAQQSGCACAV